MIRDHATTIDRTRTPPVPVPRADGEVPLREPAQAPRRSRPPSEYWDVVTARWVTTSQQPAPRTSE